ncbi:ABC transporter ATP-binding protein [Deinococcus hopiensis]|uniref:Sulfonate transport system ATP-binding protein n=1 Tax=Deinococcus hopiensis KR-140 TaxID=695939 RepID=A0A1W1UHL7_9DEIO|nr:ABC transporter ATP-binding protein [Deinococcus hopiensis]SMB80522.1 sulfonate transport system ATP-binding protein [Deinococcus hopiensis KR-140]
MTAALDFAGPHSVPGAGVQLRDLAVHYGDRAVLHGLNLEINPGERIAVVGASGGGKTTLLRVLAGLTLPSAGQVRVSHTQASPRIRVMFQEDRLLPWLGALDNVTLGLPKAERHRGEDALRDVGLAGRERAYPHELSGGQRQRVALARALAHRPALLLLDEPFGALDALTRAGMHDLLEQLLGETGATTLLVTHDLDEALKLADRVLLLGGGGVAEDLQVTAGPRDRVSLEPLRQRLEERLH